jgi:hypothetical protein
MRLAERTGAFLFLTAVAPRIRIYLFFTGENHVPCLPKYVSLVRAVSL